MDSLTYHLSRLPQLTAFDLTPRLGRLKERDIRWKVAAG
eukprot:COSAG06_NODE_39236_length_414_cov_1685.784127_2_plen_38_part_01